MKNRTLETINFDEVIKNSPNPYHTNRILAFIFFEETGGDRDTRIYYSYGWGDYGKGRTSDADPIPFDIKNDISPNYLQPRITSGSDLSDALGHLETNGIGTFRNEHTFLLPIEIYSQIQEYFKQKYTNMPESWTKVLDIEEATGKLDQVRKIPDLQLSYNKIISWNEEIYEEMKGFMEPGLKRIERALKKLDESEDLFLARKAGMSQNKIEKMSSVERLMPCIREFTARCRGFKEINFVGDYTDSSSEEILADGVNVNVELIKSIGEKYDIFHDLKSRKIIEITPQDDEHYNITVFNLQNNIKFEKVPKELQDHTKEKTEQLLEIFEIE